MSHIVEDEINISEITDKPKRSWKYDIIHEVCHLIVGYSCCKEHMEFEAHGAAKLLCGILQIDIGDAEERMSCYAGHSSHEACGRCASDAMDDDGSRDVEVSA